MASPDEPGLEPAEPEATNPTLASPWADEVAADDPEPLSPNCCESVAETAPLVEPVDGKPTKPTPPMVEADEFAPEPTNASKAVPDALEALAQLPVSE